VRSLEQQGILYVAAGKKYIRAAIRSAKTVQKNCPGLPIHLFADWQNQGIQFEQSPFPFTSIGGIDSPHRRSKVDFLQLSPFDRTLYLDSDTALNTDIRDLFRVLERFDIALCHAHWRINYFTTRQWRIPIPAAFPQFNSGVILYGKSERTLAFLEDWRENFYQANYPQDQATMRESLWLSNLRIATLPPEYNVRFIKYHFLWSKSEAETKIFHLQKYHDGPFWFLKAWSKRLIRTVLMRLGIDPASLKRKNDNPG
jgi:hypothetical protein